MDDLGTAALQRLDDFHAREQPALLRVEAVDFLDLLVERGNFPRQEVVAIVLMLDRGTHLPVAEQHDQACGGQCRAERQEEFLALALALCLTPRQQVDSWHQSKLLSARPQAVSNAVASFFTPCARARVEIFI